MISNGKKQLPSGWRETPLGDLVTILRGVTYKKQDATTKPAAGRIPILRATNIDYRLTFSDLIYVPEEYVSKSKLLNVDDIVIAASSGSRHVVGKAAALTVPWVGSFGAFCYGLRPHLDSTASYISLFLQTSMYRDHVSVLSAGVTINNLRREHIEGIPLPVAPLTEQYRIVAKIEELFSELDKGVESLKTAREKLKVYRQALLKQAFEGKLTEQWREENKDKLETPEQLLSRISTERNRRYQRQIKEWSAAVRTWEESGKSGRKPTTPKRPTRSWKPKDVNPILSADSCVDLPTAWRWTTVSEIADLVTDGTHHTPDYTDSGVPFVSVKDVRYGRVSFDDCKFISRDDHEVLIQRCHPEPGDLLITKSGTIGRLAIVPDREFSLFVSVALVKIQSAQAHISSRWLRYAFEHHIMGLNINQQIKGGLLKNYHLEDLRLARLPLCNVQEQEELVCQVEEKLSVLEELGATLDQQLIRTHALRQSVLKKAFAGQLVAQDPHDEPASVLLDRIRAEREQVVKNNASRKTKKRTAP